MKVNIVSYRPEWGHYFESINREWIEAFFSMEPVDEQVLKNHQEKILDRGGFIFFAQNEKGEIVGTVALKPDDDGEMELTKMGVIPAFRGYGIGKLLVKYCIDFAQEKGWKRLFLDSSRRLENAIDIYRKFGFKEIPVPASEYNRCDIRMEINF